MGRVTGTAHSGRAASRVLRRLAVGATTVGLALLMGGFGTLSAAATGGGGGGGGGRPPKPVAAVKCLVQKSSVVGGTATFTVGPEKCTVKTEPISFSTYALPGGYAKPLEKQTLFAHAEGNGQQYGPGKVVLTAALPSCRWQSDLYWGKNQATAPHSHPISGLQVGWDLNEGEPCVTPTPTATPTPGPTPTPPPPADRVDTSAWVSGTWTCADTAVAQSRTITTTASVWDSASGAWVEAAPVVRTESRTYELTADELRVARAAAGCDVVPSPSPSPSPTASVSATPVPTDTATALPTPTPTVTSEVLAGTPSPSPSVTYRSEVLAAPVGGVLASTGSSAGPFVAVAAVLLVAGGVLVALRRRANGGDA